jgi:hypothetical protein
MRTWLAVWFLVQSGRDWDGVSVGETQVMRMVAGREGARGEEPDAEKSRAHDSKLECGGGAQTWKRPKEAMDL